MGIAEVARGDFPPLKKYAYLDSASTGLLPQRTAQAIGRFLSEYFEEGENWDYVLESVVECRKLFARLVGARFEEVATAPNVSTALAVFAYSLGLRQSDNVVVSAHNFPTGIHIWQAARRRGIIGEVRIAEGREDSIESLIDDSTRIVSIDYVSWLTGYTYDLRRLAEVAHRHGALMVSDIFHAAGVIPLDVKKLGLDAAFCGSYKWLNGPPGVAFIYISEELLGEIEPAYMGWMGVSDSVIRRMLDGVPLFDEEFDVRTPQPAPDASRLELGSWSSLSVVGMRESLNYHLSFDQTAKHNHIRELAKYCEEHLRGLGLDIIDVSERLSGTVAFRHPKPRALGELLQKRGVIISARPRLVRISAHFYNNRSDIDRLVDVIAEGLKQGLDVG